MSNKVDWKDKYLELRSKYMNAIDAAFRLGVQEGQKAAELENMQMQLQQAQEQAAAAAAAQQMGGMAGGGLPPEEGGMPGEEGLMPGEEMSPEEGEEVMQEGGQDLDQSIDELEQYVKTEKGQIDLAKIMKNIHTTKIRKSEPKDLSEKKADIAKILSKW